MIKAIRTGTSAFFTFLLIMMLILSACSPKNVDDSLVNSEGFSSQDDGKLSVGQSGKGIKPAMIILAMESGYFEEEGIEVELVQIQNLNDGITAVSQNKLDVLPLGIIPSVTYIAQGADLVIFGGTIAEGSEAVCRPEDVDRYKDIDSLGGLTITCMRPETGHMFVQDYLTQQGDHADWLELDNFQSGIESVKKGTADFGFVNSGFGYNAVKQGLVVPFVVADYFPRNVCCRQTTNRETFTKKRETLIRFEMANLRAYALAYGQADHREVVIDRLVNYSSLEPDFVEYCVFSGVMKYEIDPATDRVRDFYELMKRDNQINPSDETSIDDHMDLSIYMEALRRLIEREPDEKIYRQLLDTIDRDNIVFVNRGF